MTRLLHLSKMDCKSLAAYNNASPPFFDALLPANATIAKASIVITNTLSATHLHPHPNRTLLVQQKPVRRVPIVRPRKKKSSESTNLLDVLRLMDALRLQIGVDVYSELVQECTASRDPVGAEALLDHVRKNMVRPPVSLLNRLLLMNVECNLLEKARQVFDEMPVRNLTSYVTMVAANFDTGEFEKALDVFVRLMELNLLGGEADFPLWIIDCVLKACLHTMNVELGKQVHCFLMKQGHFSEPYLGSSLINFYGKCKCLEEADTVFYQMACPDTVAWTALIVNKCKEGNFDDAMDVFIEMGREGVMMNHFTYSSVLRACGTASRSAWCGKQVHAKVVKLGMISNCFVECGLIDMYAKRGSLSDARRLFGMIQDDKNVASWNSMIIGYLQHGQHVEAMRLLYTMKDVGLQPQESLFNEVRFACGSNTPEPH